MCPRPNCSCSFGGGPEQMGNCLFGSVTGRRIAFHILWHVGIRGSTCRTSLWNCCWPWCMCCLKTNQIKGWDTVDGRTSQCHRGSDSFISQHRVQCFVKRYFTGRKNYHDRQRTVYGRVRKLYVRINLSFTSTISTHPLVRRDSLTHTYPCTYDSLHH